MGVQNSNFVPKFPKIVISSLKFVFLEENFSGKKKIFRQAKIYCKTLYFSCILIWRIWSVEILLHFNLAFCHGLL